MLVALNACANETPALLARIEALESDNAELQSTISSLHNDLERSQSDLSRTQTELQRTITALETAQAEQALLQGDQGGPLAITYGGQPNQDMSWPLDYGELVLGLRINMGELGEEAEIVWQSANEEIFTVMPGEDGLSATVTPLTTGSAQLIVTIGDQETRSWVRIL